MAEAADMLNAAVRDPLGNCPDSLLESLVATWNQSRDASVVRSPLYHQLFLLLKRAIIDGSIRHGTQMPTEHQLAEAFGVSRITSRRAMDELAAENLVRRQRGRGTHVIYQFRPQAARAPIQGVLENFIQLGNNSKVRVIEIQNAPAPLEIRQMFAIEDSQPVLTTARVSSTDAGDCYAYYKSWTHAPVSTITEKALEQGSRLELLQKGGLNIVRVEQILSAVNATVPVAAELEVEPGFALLSLRRLSYDSEDQLVDVVDCLYNPRRFQYAMELSKD